MPASSLQRSRPFQGLGWSPPALCHPFSTTTWHLQVLFCFNLRLIPREIPSSFVLSSTTTVYIYVFKFCPPFRSQIPPSSRRVSAVGRLLQNRTSGKHTRVCLAGFDWPRPRPPQPRGHRCGPHAGRGPRPGTHAQPPLRALNRPASWESCRGSRQPRASRVPVSRALPEGSPVPRVPDWPPLT